MADLSSYIYIAANTVTAAGNIVADNLVGNTIIANSELSGDGGNLSNLQIANVSGIGNIATINLDGNVSNVLYGNGTFAAAPNGGGGSSYGNSNVATFLASYGSNTITTTGNVSVGNIIGNGQALSSIAGANITGTVANATYATSADTATTAGTVTTAAQPNITSVGTLTSVSVSGNANVGGNLTVTGTAKIGASQVYTWPASGGSTGYVNLGTWTQSTFTGGGMLDIKLWLHGGYNSNIAQIATIETVLIINNGAAPWASNQTGVVATGNSAVTGVATAFTKLGAAWGGANQPITSLVVVQNSTTSYTIWAQGVASYSENGMYQVTFGPNANWTNSGTFQTGAPSYGSNYVTITPQAT